MKTTYKITQVNIINTFVDEYWDDLNIYSYIVKEPYCGGNIEEFIRDNDIVRKVHFDNLNEFHKRTMILDL